MDFSLLEKHPWATGGIIVGGGVLLYLAMRRPAASDATASPYAVTGVDPQTAQLQAQATAQESQQQAYIAGLQLQGGTQVSLAQIGADVTKYNTGAAVETTDNQTAAQLALGLGQINAVVEQTRINAGLQSKYIDAIIAAFGGTPSPAVTPPPTTTVTTGPTGATSTTSQIAPPQSVTYPTTVYNVPSSVGGTNPGTIAPGAPPISTPANSGGVDLIPRPTYANCDPRDVACVMNNNGLSVQWENDNVHAQSTNNFNQCLANAQMNAGQPNYAALVSSCHSNYGM